MMDWKYIWAGGMVNAVNIQWGDQWWSGGDRLGSARVHTDETGSSVTYIGYFTAFGERLDVGFRTAYTFAGDWGYRDDGDAGLPHVGARYYEPAVGRWTSADKWLGDLYRPLSLNRYLYCEDDPVNHVDPSGHASLADWLLATGTVVAGIGGAVTYVNPVVGGAVAVVGTVVAAIGGGIQMGEYLGEALFPLPTKEPAPSPEDLDDYRRQLEEGWRSGEIPKPHHPRYHPVPIIRALDPPVYRAR